MRWPASATAPRGSAATARRTLARTAWYACLGDLKAGELDVLDASGQRLGTLPQQVGAGAAEHEEPRGVVVAVGQHPPERKQAHGVFQVEVVGGAGRDESPSQGGLAALARPDDGDDGRAPERPRDQIARGAGDGLACHLSMIMLT